MTRLEVYELYMDTVMEGQYRPGQGGGTLVPVARRRAAPGVGYEHSAVELRDVDISQLDCLRQIRNNGVEQSTTSEVHTELMESGSLV